MFYKHAYLDILLLLHSAFMLCVVKMLLKGKVGGCSLNSHGNYIIDHGKSWKNHGIMFLNFCGNPDIKLTGTNHITPCKQIFYSFTHPPPMGWGQKVKKKSESGHVAYQIKGKKVKNNMQAKCLTLYTPLNWVKRSDIEIVQISV